MLADPVALSLIDNGTRVTHRVDPPDRAALVAFDPADL